MVWDSPKPVHPGSQHLREDIPEHRNMLNNNQDSLGLKLGGQWGQVTNIKIKEGIF